MNCPVCLSGINLPFLDILDLVIHAHIAVMTGSRDDPLFYGFEHSTALFTNMVAGVKLTGTEIPVKFRECEFEFIFTDQLKAFDIYGRKTGCIGDIATVFFEQLHRARRMSASAELIADLTCLE